MTGKPATIGSMQADHALWKRRHAEWRRDIERWRVEHAAAVARLGDLQRIVRGHGEALADHARAAEQAEAAIRGHEQAIGRYLSAEEVEAPDLLGNRHQQEARAFEQQQEAHERIRRHHTAVMEQLQTLEATASAAM